MKLIKKLNKGFTLVELVVVIAVIAILSAVSVVAYTGITKKAKESGCLKEANARYTEVYSLDLADGKQDGKEGEAAIALGSNEQYNFDSETKAFVDYKYAKNGWVATYTVASGWVTVEGSLE